MGRLKLNKKAQIFSLIILFAFIFLLVSVIINVTKAPSKTEVIGKTPLEIREVYSLAEKDFFYIEQSGRYSFNNAIKILDQNNFNKPYNLSDFKIYFTLQLSDYLSNHPGKNLKVDYSIMLINDKLIATASRKLDYPFLNGKYFVDPSFSLDTDGMLVND